MSSLYIDEPFDFEGPRGGRVLNGIIFKWFDPMHLIFEAQEELTREGITSRYWLLSARYVGQIIQSKEYHGVVNGCLLIGVPSENESIRDLQISGRFGIIGSLEI
jgi:hypothetical protein